jgi:hypothetical protein
MDFLEVVNKVMYDDIKTYSNGYNTIRFGPDSYEATITDILGNEIVVILSNWGEYRDHHKQENIK